MGTLHLFIDEDNNAYAARDLAHAKELWQADTGQDPEENGWTSVSDDKPVTVDDDGAKVTKTAVEWANDSETPGCRFGSDY